MRKKELVNEPSLFDRDEEKGGRKISSVFAQFLKNERLYANELFEGYKDMKAVTSSHSITFMCQLSEKYSESEIIFGHPESLGNQQLDIIKIQGF